MAEGGRGCFLAAGVGLGLLVACGGAGIAAWAWWRAPAPPEAPAEAATTGAATTGAQADIAPEPAAAVPLVDAARGLAAEKRWAEAEAMADRALALVPDHAGALAVRGLARVQAGALAQGADDLRRAVALDPAAADAWASLGWAEARLGNDAAAIRAWSARIERVADDGRAWAERGDARFRTGDRAGALADAGESCRLGWGPGCTLERRIASAR